MQECSWGGLGWVRVGRGGWWVGGWVGAGPSAAVLKVGWGAGGAAGTAGAGGDPGRGAAVPLNPQTPLPSQESVSPPRADPAAATAGALLHIPAPAPTPLPPPPHTAGVRPPGTDPGGGAAAAGLVSAGGWWLPVWAPGADAALPLSRWGWGWGCGPHCRCAPGANTHTHTHTHTAQSELSMRACPPCCSPMPLMGPAPMSGPSRP